MLLASELLLLNGQGQRKTAAPAVYFSIAREETIFSAAVHIRS